MSLRSHTNDKDGTFAPSPFPLPRDEGEGKIFSLSLRQSSGQALEWAREFLDHMSPSPASAGEGRGEGAVSAERRLSNEFSFGFPTESCNIYPGFCQTQIKLSCFSRISRRSFKDCNIASTISVSPRVVTPVASHRYSRDPELYGPHRLNSSLPSIDRCALIALQESVFPARQKRSD
jgi:hypothetical protein